MPQAEKVLSWILKGGLLLTPFLVFIVTRSLYFPFITGKNFTFRILVELLAVVWVYAALRFPSFRPRSSALAWAVIAFLVVIGVATIFSLSPYRSFWSNFERMEGYIGLVHLALYFFLLGVAFRTERDWKIFFHASLAASVIVSVYAAAQLAGKFVIHQGGTRVDATLGNATYLAAYLLFHLFFLIWFFLRSENRWLQAGYAVAFLFEGFILYQTATRGAVIGLIGGSFVLAAFLAAFGRGAIRRWAIAAMGLAALVPIGFFLVKDAAFVKRSPVLVRFSTISFQEQTTQSRFTIWGMALRGWRERPILGWGQESFTYVFSKYYEPSLWRQEPWFDRAHNVFLDWLIAGGIFGLASYLGMFGAAFWTVLASFRAGRTILITAAVMAALLAAHLFQILFVFDNLTSWLLFFTVLAYLHSAAVNQPAVALPVEARGRAARSRRSGGTVGLPVGIPAAGASLAVAAFAFVFYFGDLKPILAARDILTALKTAQAHEPAGKVDAVIGTFRAGIGRHTFGTTELREQLSQLAVVVTRDQSLAPQDKVKYLEFSIRELETGVREFPADVRAKAFLTTLYASAGRPADALAAVESALALNDRRPQFYFVAAEVYLNAGQSEQAIAAVRRAYDLAPDYPEAVANLATVLILSRKSDEAEALLERHYGKRLLAEERYANVYAQVGAFEKAAAIWKLIADANPSDARSRASLGVLYWRLGETAEAIRAIGEAIEREPAFRGQGEEIIKAIQKGERP